VQGQQRCLYWLLAETGIRAGELAGLRIQDVALDSITVEQSVWGGEEQQPKTQNAVRKIAISTQLAELLWKQIGRQKAAGHSFLFTVGNGSPLDINVERSRRLAPLLETLELAKAGYHAFRHFNVSMMDALRVPLKTIQERIGHALTGELHPGRVWPHPRLERERGCGEGTRRGDWQGRCGSCREQPREQLHRFWSLNCSPKRKLPNS
jgi:integrase